MSNNLLIVESDNDKFFIESLKIFLNNIDLEIDFPVCSIDDYECLGGLSLASLKKKLSELKITIEKKGINKVGILLDADNDGIQAKLDLITNAFEDIDSSINITETNALYHSEKLGVDIACHILNIDGHGELETVLKNIKSAPSYFSDCLEQWKSCLEQEGKTISDKEFDKIWVSIYQRYDCCSIQEKRQAGKKCNPEASMKKDIWDFSHPSLNDLITFLKLF